MPLVSFVLLVLSALAFLAPSQPSQVNQAEVRRLGSLVQLVGVDHDPEVDAYVEALGPPASDADKWFISVVMQRCQACSQLKRDWASDPWLLALADPADPKQSWAHFNFYDKDDDSQSWRWADITVTAYPTILVQPPRSGKYGDPRTVVYQGVYHDDPHQLATDITTSIRRYVSRLIPPEEYGQSDVRPPWKPVPKDDPDAAPRPLVRPNPLDSINIPPDLERPRPLEERRTMSNVMMFLAGAGIPTGVALLVLLLRFVRTKRQEMGKQPILDGETFEQLLGLLRLLQTLVETQSKNPPGKTEAAEPAQRG